MDAVAGGDSVGVINQELTPFYPYLPREYAGAFLAWGRENGGGWLEPGLGIRGGSLFVNLLPEIYA